MRHPLFVLQVDNLLTHVVRMQQAITNHEENCIPVSTIDISINDDGIITMLNDGNGVDVAAYSIPSTQNIKYGSLSLYLPI